MKLTYHQHADAPKICLKCDLGIQSDASNKRALSKDSAIPLLLDKALTVTAAPSDHYQQLKLLKKHPNLQAKFRK
jgi:hypothetical protein